MNGDYIAIIVIVTIAILHALKRYSLILFIIMKS